MFIQTCPDCGSDLTHIMLTSNPPIQKVSCSCGFKHEVQEKTVRSLYKEGHVNLMPDRNPCPPEDVFGDTDYSLEFKETLDMIHSTISHMQSGRQDQKGGLLSEDDEANLEQLIGMLT